MIVNNAVKSSGGVKIAKASSNKGGAGLEGGGSRQVSSNLSAAKVKQSRSGNGGGLAERPSENIEKFMDRNKNSFFSLYNRALRKNPSMQGEVIFNIVILANGSVSEVSIVSSDLNNPTLERKLLTKIRSIRFTAMNVVVWKDNYRINFIPS
jgi:TonB family protein